jgi:hypothetical protein
MTDFLLIAGFAVIVNPARRGGWQEEDTAPRRPSRRR